MIRQRYIGLWEDSPALAPTPTIVVDPSTSMMPHPLRVPETLMTPPEPIAELSAEQEDTVTPDPLPPPVVPAP